jgi:hypothetical protein
VSDVADPGKTLISAFQLMGAAVNAHEREQTPDQLRDALLAEAAEAVPFDHWVWGRGHAQPDGTMLIDGDGLASLGSGFIEDMYNKYWRFIDVVGQMHVACPHLVQVWDVPLEKQSQDAKPRVGRVPNLVDDNLSQAAADAAEYLRAKKIERVMLARIGDTRRGSAWLTIYRDERR